MEKLVEGTVYLIGRPKYMFLAGRFQPEPEVVSIPVEPAGVFETIRSPGSSRNQRGKRSLPQDNTETLAS